MCRNMENLHSELVLLYSREVTHISGHIWNVGYTHCMIAQTRADGHPETNRDTNVGTQVRICTTPKQCGT